MEAIQGMATDLSAPWQNVRLALGAHCENIRTLLEDVMENESRYIGKSEGNSEAVQTRIVRHPGH